MKDSDREFVAHLMRRQAALGLKVTAAFLIVLFGLPLLNTFAPELMATRIGGFSLSWLILAILFYPITWLLAWLFVKKTEAIEHEQAAEARERGIGQ